MPAAPASRRARALASLLTAVAVAGAAAAPARADHPDVTAPSVTERERFAEELRLLGRSHALEHRAARRLAAAEARRWARLSPAGRRAELRRRARLEADRDARYRALRSGGATTSNATQGAWQAPVAIPTYAIHSVLLPTGKVLFWGYPPFDRRRPETRPNEGEATLWDPTEGTGRDAFERIDPPLIDHDGDRDTPEVAAPIYCSGQNLLADGRVLLAGGNRSFPAQDGFAVDSAGARFAFVFDPWREEWVRQADMATGRWYPSQLTQPDGSTLVVGGYNQNRPGGVYTDLVEVFRPTRDPDGSGPRRPGTWTTERVRRRTALYPHLRVLPDGNALLGGPGRGDSAIWNRTTRTYRQLKSPRVSRVGGTSILADVPAGGGSWRLTQWGGYDTAAPGHDEFFAPAYRTGETVDASRPGSEWQAAPSFNVARSYHNTVALPDGSLVTIGGGKGKYGRFGPNWRYGDEVVDPGDFRTYQGRRYRASQFIELYDPATRRWRLGPPQLEDRTYHSVGLLLPDGRVMSAGDDSYESQQGRIDSIELYSPPYLFKGARPRIADAPERLKWNRDFEVETPDAARITRAVLVAPAATTHAADMNQRRIQLSVARGSGRVRLRAPRNTSAAPPGPYMLFLLDARGVPSVAEFVQMGNADAKPPEVRLRLLRSQIARLVRTGKLKLRVTTDEPIRLSARVRVPRAQGSRRTRSVRRRLRVGRAGARTLSLRLSDRQRRDLAGQRRARITVTATAVDRKDNATDARTRRTYRR